MARYNVVPDKNGSGWRLKKNGRTISNHRKQSAAIKKAKKNGGFGDELYIHGTDGRIRDQTTIVG